LQVDALFYKITIFEAQLPRQVKMFGNANYFQGGHLMVNLVEMVLEMVNIIIDQEFEIFGLAVGQNQWVFLGRLGLARHDKTDLQV
jgi:hypothetical protein